MTTTHHRTGTPTRLAQIPAAVAAISGRFGWRLWWPLAAWLVAAAFAGLDAALRRIPGEDWWNTTPSGVLLLAGLAAIPILWLVGVRFALTLGLDRGVVFGVGVALAVGLQAALHALSLTAGLVEMRTAGAQGVHVFALESLDLFGSHTTFANATWILVAIYLIPLAGLVLLVSASVLRWGARGLAAVPIVLVAAMVVIVVGGMVGWNAPAPIGPLLEVATVGLFWVAPLVASWLVYRRTPV